MSIPDQQNGGQDDVSNLYWSTALFPFPVVTRLLTPSSCGLPEGTETRLDAEAQDWRISGKYAVISFAAKHE